MECSTDSTSALIRNAVKGKKYLPGAIDESVLVYNIKTELLDTRPISTVYGVRNLYKDVRNIDDVHEIEKKLSVLESRASRAVSTILAATGTSSCKLVRNSLIDLRKFLFIMHIRSSRLSGEYFKERSDKIHLPGLEWIQSYKKRHGLESETEMWLHTLRYYLDTPHRELMQHGREIKLKYGAKIMEMLTTRIDPDEEHFNALAYEGLADGHFLCIWEVADGEEFVLGDSSFGIWEGTAGGFDGLHRLFVLSPRIIIVLSMQFLRPEVFSQLPEKHKDTYFSTLMDIEHASPIPTYPGGAPKNEEDLAAIVAREEDMFEFKIIKLSVPQSRHINALMLYNLPETGSMTFVSKTSMLRTLRSYLSDFRFINKQGYVPLLHIISEVSLEETGIGSAKAKTESEKPVDFMLWVTATKVLSGERAYRSQYDRGVVFFLLVKNTQPPAGSLCEEYSRILSSIMDGYRRRSDSPLPSAAVPQKGELVRSLSKANSDKLFQFMEKWMRNLAVIKPKIAAAVLMYETAVIGFLDWLVNYQPKFVMAAALSAQLTVPILEY
jgi:Protein of unknown function (DUF4238)